jgi:hypothetical protein
MAVLKNEQDVREEIATPLLKLLGYESGTANDISREHRLRYTAMQLGHKKSNDAPLPLGGNADYMLTIAGAGRWILETKPPDQNITADDVDQTVSYARHPEVSGHYAAVLNGRRFALYYSSQTSNDAPIVDLEVISIDHLANALQGLLSPLAIRRDCALPVVDLKAPLAPGFRSEAKITGGTNKHLSLNLETELLIPPPQLQMMQAQFDKIVGMQSTVKSGRIWRDNSGRIRARLAWNSPHEEMIPLLQAAHLDEFEYVCLQEEISSDPENPSVFDILAAYELKEGLVIYDILKWEARVNGFNAAVSIQGQATGYLCDGEFVGLAGFCSTTMVQGATLPIKIHFLTEFCFLVDQK